MPKYGTFKYGQEKYGKYELRTPYSSALGPYTQYRMRLHNHEGDKGPYTRMAQERISLPPNINHGQIRIRSNQGQWIYSQSETFQKETHRVRIRSISQEEEASPWVYGEKGNLKLI